MSDYKNYIVNYDIKANTGEAVTGLENLQRIATNLEAPMKQLQQTMTTVNQTLTALKNNANFVFEPKIDVRTFDQQLKSMVLRVKAAATEMHSALYGALKGNASGTNAMKQGAEKSLGAKSIKELKSSIEAYEKELDKLMGTPKKGKNGKMIRAKDGSILMAQNAGLTDRVVDLKARKEAIQQHLKATRAELAAMEQMKKEVAATQAKGAQSQRKLVPLATKQAASQTSQPAKLTNVTPAVIREWGKVFGNAKSKSLTISIKANAGGNNGAITVINQVKASLEGLHALGKFEIAPTLNKAALTNAEAQLTNLANLSKAIAAPFAGNTAKGATATKVAMTGATGKQGAAKAEVPATVKIAASQVNSALKAIPRPTLPVNLKLGWKKGAIGKQAQLKEITSKIPPVKLTLDTSLAVEKLNEFITLLKSKSPQSIALTATGTATNAATSATTASSTTAVATSTSGGGSKGKTPPTARERYEAMQKKALASTLSTKQTVEKWKGYNAQAENYHAERQRMYNSLFGTGSTRAVRQKMYNELFGAVPQQPGWQQAANRAKRLDDADEKKRTAKNTADHKRRASALRAQVHNTMLPFASNQSQLNTLMQHRKFFSRAINATGIVPMQGMQAPQMLRYLQNVSQQMQSANVQVPMQLQQQINKLQAQIAKTTQTAAQASQAASTASKAATGSKSKVQTVRVAESPKSFYDRSRKWAYPFTGNTSFGARTPMAVEMAKGMGVMFAVGGAMSAVGGSFSEAVEYQNLMRTTNAILKNGTDTYTPSGFANMERTVRDVGIKTKFSAPEVASAAKFLAMAGYDIEAINNAIQPIADLALIGDADLGETADKMTNIMTTFGYDSKYMHKNPEIMRQLGNIMATTATRSNTDLMMLAESAKYGGGVAKLYGGKDPNLFADTMALFGVMGNAGIQASSAGTALRMMYQNIFKPNKNQAAMLKQLEDLGVYTHNTDGSYRSMIDILIDIANKVPEKQMADVVGKLFRITAQPGAAATLNAAAQEDGTDAAQVAGGIDAVAKFATEKGGLSALVSLMQANRASASGNILGSVAEEKQNTIKGLWAQVTSTFTEGILVAFEKNENYFVDKLSQLRDYLAKPETANMIQKLFDMIISIGEMMAKFVKIWVGFYDKFAPIVKAWVWTQMFFTQVGSLITPLISVISVFDRLRTSLMAFSGVSTATSAISAAGSAVKTGGLGGAATVLMANGLSQNLPFGAKRQVRGNTSLASRYQKHTGRMALQGITGANAKNEYARFIAGFNDRRITRAVNLQMSSRQSALNAIARNEAVVARAKQIYGIGPRMSRAFAAGATYTSFFGLGSVFASLKSMFSGLMVSLSKAVGLLFNPITLAIGYIGGLGYSIYELNQYAKGITKTQIEARKGFNNELTESLRVEKERRQSTEDLLNKNGFSIGKMGDFVQSSDDEGKSKKNKWYDSYKYLFNENISTIKGASRKTNEGIVDAVKNRYINDSTLRLALSESEYKALLGTGLNFAAQQAEEDVKQLSTMSLFNASGSSMEGAVNRLTHGPLDGDKNTATRLRNKMALLAIKNEGANDDNILRARQKIVDLYKKLGHTEEFKKQAKSILDNVVNPNDFNLLGDEYITLENLKNPNFDWSKLQSYAWAGYRVLENEINASKGSMIDSLLAMDELKKGLIPYTETWNEAISRLVGNFRIIRSIAFNNKIYDNIEILMNTLPDGTLDFSSILKQLQDKIEGFKGDIKLYIQFANKVYQMMLDMGVVKDGSMEARVQFTRKQLKNMGLSDAEIERYYTKTEEDAKREDEARRRNSDPFGYKNASNPTGLDNAWGNYQSNMLEMAKSTEWQIPMATPNASSFTPWAKELKRKEDKALDKMISEDAKQYIKQADAAKGNGTGGNGTGGNGTGNGTDQTGYGSNYDRSSAKPTQIVFNIDKLANFDRTVVAASAEERDLIASMESRITETVYRIFAEAANRASSSIS